VPGFSHAGAAASFSIIDRHLPPAASGTSLLTTTQVHRCAKAPPSEHPSHCLEPWSQAGAAALSASERRAHALTSTLAGIAMGYRAHGPDSYASWAVASLCGPQTKIGPIAFDCFSIF
jgi:hypothetical protein